jgi:putative copper resistance protein D
VAPLLLRLLVLYVHLLAAMFWIGEMLFLAVVVGPYSRTLAPAQRAELFRQLGRRSRPYAWAAILVLLATGVGNVALMGIPFTQIVQHSFLASPLGAALALKLATIAVLLLSVIWHDLVLAERSARLQREMQARGPRPDLLAAAERTRRAAGWLGRLNLVLALVVVFFGVELMLGV